MTAYIVRRLLAVVPTALGISLLAFMLAALSPGDPAELILNRQLDEPPTEQQLSDFRARTGLDDPLPIQYGRFLLDLTRADLGTSFRSGEPVVTEIASRIGPTLQLALPALALSVTLAVSVGVVAALRRNSLADHGSRLAALLFESVPTFVLAYLLILGLSVGLGVLPVAGRGTPQHFVLPVVTLALATTAGMMRLMRANLLETMGQAYVRTARAMGIPRRRVVLHHALKNAILPVVTLAGMLLAGFVTGTVIVETVFAWPGVGRYIVEAIFARDYAVIRGFVVFTGAVFLVANLLVDLLYVRLDPRVRLTTGPAQGHG